MSVSPLSRGPRTITVGGSIRIPADATPPVD